MADDLADRLRAGITVLLEVLKSCESCRQAPADYIIHDTFVCVSCSKVA